MFIADFATKCAELIKKDDKYHSGIIDAFKKYSPDNICRGCGAFRDSLEIEGGNFKTFQTYGYPRLDSDTYKCNECYYHILCHNSKGFYSTRNHDIRYF